LKRNLHTSGCLDRLTHSSVNPGNSRGRKLFRAGS
jgi:hypothetical protein